MPLYWAAASTAGTAMSTQAQYEIAAALSLAGWAIAAGIAWWNEDGTPRIPEGMRVSWTVCRADGPLTK